MDKNIRYAIRQGHPIVRMLLTYQDAIALRDVMISCYENGLTGGIAYVNGKPLTSHVADILDNAIRALEV